MTTKFAAKPASAKQVSFIATLAAERVNGALYVQTQLAACKVSAVEALSSSQASNIIGVLLNEPKGKTAAPAAPAKVKVTVGEGFYIDTEDRIFQVVQGKNGLYAKVLEVKSIGTCGGCEHCDGEDACQKSKGKFVYAPGAIKESGEWIVLTKDIAIATSKKFGSCCICGRTLSAKTSVEAGIGPICAGKVF